MTKDRPTQKAVPTAQEIERARLQEFEDAEFFRMLKLLGVMGGTVQDGKKRRNRKLPAGCFTLGKSQPAMA